jgi:hypothetical protein
VQRQNTSSTGEREKEWGGGCSMKRRIPDGLLFCLCCSHYRHQQYRDPDGEDADVSGAG